MSQGQDRFDSDDADHFQPVDPRTQDEIGGVLERAFSRERGKEPNEEEARRLHALADEALQQAEVKLSLAREAEDLIRCASERYGVSRESADMAEVEKWTRAAEDYRREAEEFRQKAELLRQHIV